MHPYQRVPLTAVWSRSVARDFDASALVQTRTPLVRQGERVATAGSCFASNIVPYLEREGLTYLRTETPHPALQGIPAEDLGYGAFSAAYGHVYTVRQLLQLFRRSDGQFTPVEDRWHTEAGVIDPFRPGLRYHAVTDREFDLLTAQHLRAVRNVFIHADVFIFTLGLTEAWVSRADGAVFPVCPGTVAGTFDPERHAFVNFTVAEMTADLDAFIGALRAVNPSVRILLTVSPVPLVATATDSHVLCATTYSKSALRVVAEEAARKHRRVTYFPAYEIVTGPQAPDSYFEANRRHVTDEAVDAVMTAFLSKCHRPRREGGGEGVPVATSAPVESSAAQRLSRTLVQAECEEAMLESPPAERPKIMTLVPNPYRDAGYYQTIHEENVGYQQNNWLVEEIDRLITFKAGSILELACGNGRFLELAASRFDHVYGCDWAVSPLLPRVLAEHGNVAFFRTDLYEGLPPCQAELVVSADFLEHLAPERLDEVLRRIDAIAPKAFHKIACYDDGHSHLSVFEPPYWLECLQRIDPAYQLERTEHRLGDPNRPIAVFVKGRP